MDGESTANAIEKTSKIKQFSPLLSEKFQLYTQIVVLVMTTASAVQQKILSSCVVGVCTHLLVVLKPHLSKSPSITCFLSV